MKNIYKLFNKPKLIGIVSDVNNGKSMLTYNIIEELKDRFTYTLVTYGLKVDIKGERKINSVEELETIRDCIIFLDEFTSLIDLDNRTQKRQVENTLRLINHNNNILVLIGVPENFKKFISNKLDCVIYKKVTFGDFINGSTIKKRILSYRGAEKGSAVLNLQVGEAIIFDGSSYNNIFVPYIPKYDTKSKNIKLLRKNVKKKKQTKIKKREDKK